MALSHDITHRREPSARARALSRSRSRESSFSYQATRGRSREHQSGISRAQARAAGKLRREDRSRPRIECMGERISWLADWLLPVAAVGMVFMMLVPVPSLVLDLFLATSVTAAVIVLLCAIHILKPSNSRWFPSRSSASDAIAHRAEHCQQPPHSSARE